MQRLSPVASWFAGWWAAVRYHPALAGFTALVGVAFIVMLFFEDLRWNVIAELWGVAGAGVVLWWYLEQRSETVQQQAWLRQNARHIQPVLAALFDLADEVVQKLRGDQSHSRGTSFIDLSKHERMEILAEQHDLIGQALRVLNDAMEQRGPTSRDLTNIKSLTRQVDRQIEHGSVWLDRMPLVRRHAIQLRDSLDQLSRVIDPPISRRDFARFGVSTVLIASELCEVCDETLREVNM
jgi:cell division protein FtsW (lipid II flippase)